MSDCTCQPASFPETDCPTHGLFGDRKYPPMNRHAQKLEFFDPCPFCQPERPGVKTIHCSFCDDTGKIKTVRTETAAEAQRRLYREAHRGDAV